MAIFLTSLDILDTGFLRVGRTTPSTRVNQLASASRVNSGNALRLKGVTVNFNSSSNLDNTAVPGKFNESVTQTVQSALISSNPTTFSINIKINKNNTDTTNEWGINDMALIPYLLQLPHTKGFKAIYYPVDNATLLSTILNDRGLEKNIIYHLGAPDTTQAQGDIQIPLWTGQTSSTTNDLTEINYVAVRFNSCKITQTPNNMIDITLSGVITE